MKKHRQVIISIIC